MQFYSSKFLRSSARRASPYLTMDKIEGSLAVCLYCRESSYFHTTMLCLLGRAQPFIPLISINVNEHNSLGSPGNVVRDIRRVYTFAFQLR